jgi:hypothetical protein
MESAETLDDQDFGLSNDLERARDDEQRDKRDEGEEYDSERHPGLQKRTGMIVPAGRDCGNVAALTYDDVRVLLSSHVHVTTTPTRGRHGDTSQEVWQESWGSEIKEARGEEAWQLEQICIGEVDQIGTQCQDEAHGFAQSVAQAKRLTRHEENRGAPERNEAHIAH